MRRILALALLALAAVTGLPSTAHAGGPTSVLVTQPGVSAAGLYYTDAEYDDLLRLLPTDRTRGKGMPPGGGVSYNLTWMVHDFMPWRFDSVSVYGDGTAWVATKFTAQETAGWQSLGKGTELFDLLQAVLDDGTEPGPISETMTKAASVTPAETRTVTETEWFSLTGWRWLLPGALLGLLVGAVAARRRTEVDEPRRALVEASPIILS